MGIPSYITQNSGGIVCIDCNTAPDRGFLDAVKTKDIVKIRILTRQEKRESTNYKPGGPDVMVISLTGEKQLIYRKDLVNKYVHTDGNRIKLSILSSGTSYIAYNVCNEPYKILKLPSNCVALLPSGKRTKQGDYVVAKADASGQVNRATLSSMSPSSFRKMFKIPMQPVIKRHMGNRSKTSQMFTLINKQRLQRNMINNTPIRSRIDSSEIGMNPANINIKSVNDSNVIGNGVRKTFTPTMNKNINSKDTISHTNYRYKVLAKIVNMDKHLMGFVVEDMVTGKRNNLKINELTQLCMKKSVENVMVVRNQKGNLYLKGNGCSIENMQQVIM